MIFHVDIKDAAKNYKLYFMKRYLNRKKSGAKTPKNQQKMFYYRSEKEIGNLKGPKKKMKR